MPPVAGCRLDGAKRTFFGTLLSSLDADWGSFAWAASASCLARKALDSKQGSAENVEQTWAFFMCFSRFLQLFRHCLCDVALSH